MNFKQFADIINKKFMEMSKSPLFTVNTPRELLWETYQSAYSAKDNPIFRERRVHECNTCLSFIRRLGTVVTISDDYTLDTIWNVEGLSAPYDAVAATMHALVSSSAVTSVFLTDERLAGREFNIEENETGNIKWNHFYADINATFISQTVATTRGDIDTTVSVFKRALDEFSISSLETVIDLCDSIYKGEEFKPTVQKFLLAKKAYSHPLFIWKNYDKYPARIRNSAIGTLIIDIEAGLDLEEAVRKYEAVVAPTNYKRSSAVVTPGMKKLALKTIATLELEPSLARRHAHLDDISINNVIFADRSAKKVMKGTLDALLSTNAVAKPSATALDISIDTFLSDVVPTATAIEVLVENRLTPNFVSLVAPVNADAPNMLKWSNNFTWSYNGEVTDSMKERVKAAGGSVDGVLRCTLQWNEDGNDSQNDLDLHCNESHGTHIYYGNNGQRHASSGMLDVDIRRPGSKVAIENIIYTDMSKMNGTYQFYVNNYGGRNSDGFRAQIEFDGIVYEFNYPSSVKADIVIATVSIVNGKFVMQSSLKNSQSQKTEWDVTTLQYQPVSTIMLSPNHWDEQHIGNKHFFFMLEGCKNPSAVRGFYNEFLSDDLTKHRKVFEMLSEAMKCEPSDEQLSGLGFSSTIRNNVQVKVDGRPYNVIF
jgi:hypothetical protein